MERNLSTSELSNENQIVINAQENSLCEVCGLEFGHPLLAELISGDHAEEYYACPRCLTKVGEVERQERIVTDEADAEEGEEVEVEEAVLEVNQESEPVKTESPTSCANYLGYLKKRPKDVPIPETCFVCVKMIECMR